jgi:hypothetical protein
MSGSVRLETTPGPGRRVGPERELYVAAVEDVVPVGRHGACLQFCISSAKVHASGILTAISLSVAAAGGPTIESLPGWRTSVPEGTHR